MSKCLVTGGAGFIGSSVADALVLKGHEVFVFDNLSTGKKENLNHHGENIKFILGDLRNKKAICDATKGIDYIFHIGALRAVLRSVDDPSETNDVNITGTLNVLQAAREFSVRRVVFSSSSSVYGETEEFPLKEDAKPRPESPYAASKIMGEYYCQLFTKLYGLETVCLRYFNVFGPRQNPESKYSAVIPIFIDALLKEKSPEIHWDGLQARDFSYVDNVVHGNLLAMEAKGVSGEVFNIACHEEYSVLAILENVKEILNIHDVQPTFQPKRSGDVRRTFADISKAENLLGYRVQTRFREGLQKTVDWFLTQPAFSSSAKYEVAVAAR